MPKIRVSKETIGVILYIFFSALFMRQVMEFGKARIGERGFTAFIALLFISAGIAFFAFILKNKSNLLKKSALIFFVLVGIFFTWQIEIPQERIHILVYGILGWFIARDLIFSQGDERSFWYKKAILAFGLIVIVGILDEGVQEILPYRIWDLRDILFNSLGGLWGIGLYLLK